MKRCLLLILALAACSDDAATTPPASTPDSGTSSTPECTAALKSHLNPVATTSSGEVKVLSTDGGVTTVFVDAAAGGAHESAKSPRVYIKLTGERVSISDDEALESSDWDIALKRVDIFTNSGDAGPGQGGAVQIAKAFDAVTVADADSAPIAEESFFDAECVGKKDEGSFIITTMSNWYDYAVGGGISVKANASYVVRAADGTARYKVGIVTYKGKNDGSTSGGESGRYILKIAPL